MKLKKKVYIFHALTGIVIFIIFILFYKFHFTVALTKLKKEKADVLTEGVTTLLNKEIQRITLSSDDTAAWDTMYRYVVNPTEEIEKDMAPDLFIKYMKLSLYIVVDNDLKTIYSTGYDRRIDKKIEFNEFKKKKGEIWDFLLESFRINKNHEHIISTKHGIIMIVSSPIVKSDGSGTSRGRFLLGHIIDDQFFTEVSNTLGENVCFRDRNFIPENARLLLKNEMYKLYEDADFINILKDVYDTHGEYAFTFEINAKKNISKTFRNIIFIYTLGLLVIFLGAAIVIYLFFNKFILKKIEYISEKTTQIVTSEDLSITFPVSSNDEICQLKRNLNNMLKRMKREISKDSRCTKYVDAE